MPTPPSPGSHGGSYPNRVTTVFLITGDMGPPPPAICSVCTTKGSPYTLGKTRFWFSTSQKIGRCIAYAT
eukprot:2614294-Rhodomonas_salina.1